MLCPLPETAFPVLSRVAGTPYLPCLTGNVTSSEKPFLTTLAQNLDSLSPVHLLFSFRRLHFVNLVSLFT